MLKTNLSTRWKIYWIKSCIKRVLSWSKKHKWLIRSSKLSKNNWFNCKFWRWLLIIVMRRPFKRCLYCGLRIKTSNLFILQWLPLVKLFKRNNLIKSRIVSLRNVHRIRLSWKISIKYSGSISNLMKWIKLKK